MELTPLLYNFQGSILNISGFYSVFRVLYFDF